MTDGANSEKLMLIIDKTVRTGQNINLPNPIGTDKSSRQRERGVSISTVSGRVFVAGGKVRPSFIVGGVELQTD